jgi:hypothetical protein
VKRLPGFILFICLITPFIGTYTLFQYKKYLVKKEVKCQLIKRIDRQQLVLVKVATKEIDTKLHWKHSREFELEGHMYDVVEREMRSDTAFLYCWPDHAESQINKQLTILMSQALGQHPQSRDHQKRLVDFFKTLFCSSDNCQSKETTANADKLIHPHFHPAYSSFLIPPPSPPPKIG